MNYSDLLKLKPLHKNRVEIAGPLLQGLTHLEPGGILELRNPEGRSFVVLDREDFDHLIELAGCRANDLPFAAEDEG